MSYIALYRKWRPVVFDDLVGQESIVKILKSQIINQRIAHAYLFSGGRGTGKTTTAKIFSRAVNCTNLKQGNPCNECDMCRGIMTGNIMDVVEIDAASNNSVDNIRTIRDEVFYTPSISKFRVYIVDEVHMLSTGAYNALLKILEEPPKHVIFILATTEPHKLPATILSRCQRFEFRQISSGDMIERLKLIVIDSGASIENEALDLISRVADGALRDAISVLDQCMDGGGSITKEKVIEVVGIPKEETMLNLAEAILERDISECINVIDILGKEGKDLSQFVSVLVRFFRDILVYKLTKVDEGIYLTPGETGAIRSISSKYSQNELIRIIMSLSELESNLKWASMPRVMVEVEMVKLCSEQGHIVNSSIEERITRIEELISRPISGKDINVINRGENIDLDLPVKPDKVKKKEETKVNKDESLDDWDKIVAELKNSGKIVLYANLIGTKAIRIDNKTIGIVFNKSAGEFGKTVISKNENHAILKGAIKKITGEDMNIRCILDGNVGENAEPRKVIDKKEKITEMVNNFDIPINIIDE